MYPSMQTSIHPLIHSYRLFHFTSFHVGEAVWKTRVFLMIHLKRNRGAESQDESFSESFCVVEFSTLFWGMFFHRKTKYTFWCRWSLGYSAALRCLPSWANFGSSHVERGETGLSQSCLLVNGLGLFAGKILLWILAKEPWRANNRSPFRVKVSTAVLPWDGL